MRQSCIVFQTASYMWNVADFNPPHLHLAPPVGGDPGRISRRICRQKTRVHGRLCGTVSIILCLAIFVENRLVTDGRTHGHNMYRASISSRGKKDYLLQNVLNAVRYVHIYKAKWQTIKPRSQHIN